MWIKSERNKLLKCMTNTRHLLKPNDFLHSISVHCISISHKHRREALQPKNQICGFSGSRLHQQEDSYAAVSVIDCVWQKVSMPTQLTLVTYGNKNHEINRTVTFARGAGLSNIDELNDISQIFRPIYGFNSLRHIYIVRRHGPKSTLVHVMACVPDGTMSLPGPMLILYQRCSMAFTMRAISFGHFYTSYYEKRYHKQFHEQQPADFMAQHWVPASHFNSPHHQSPVQNGHNFANDNLKWTEFHGWKGMYFDSNFTEVCSCEPN